VVDEYAGNQELKEIFNSDNTRLIRHLIKEGFIQSRTVHQIITPPFTQWDLSSA
jgi:hypothetical protein